MASKLTKKNMSGKTSAVQIPVENFPELVKSVPSKKEQKIITDSNIRNQFTDKEENTSSQKVVNLELVACTKACHFVTNGADGKYGVCFKEVCTFAHSFDELQGFPCQFGDECFFIHGKKDKATGKKISDSVCKYKHPFETVIDWMLRARITLPNLPKTSKDSRKPSVVTKSISLSEKPEAKPETKIALQVQIKQPVISENRWVKSKTVVSKPETSPMSQPLEKPAEKQMDVQKPPELPPRTKRTHKSLDVVSDASDSETENKHSDSSDEEEENISPKQQTGRSIEKTLPALEPEYIIIVPSEKFAEMAIELALEQGIGNFKVVPKNLSKEMEGKHQIIRVPSEMVKSAVKIAIKQGVKKFEVIVG